MKGIVKIISQWKKLMKVNKDSFEPAAEIVIITRGPRNTLQSVTRHVTLKELARLTGRSQWW